MRPLVWFPAFIMFIISLFVYSCSNQICEDTLCANGGVCLDGTCDCPTGFTGPRCEQQAAPDKIRLASITLTRFPTTNNGTQWDVTSGPEMFFRLVQSDQKLAQPMRLLENADQSLKHFFIINTIDLKDITAEHTLQLWDFEQGEPIDEEFMGEVSFTPYTEGNGFPKKIVIDRGGPVAFEVEVEYLYNTENR